MMLHWVNNLLSQINGIKSVFCEFILSAQGKQTGFGYNWNSDTPEDPAPSSNNSLKIVVAIIGLVAVSFILFTNHGNIECIGT